MNGTAIVLVAGLLAIVAVLFLNGCASKPYVYIIVEPDENKIITKCQSLRGEEQDPEVIAHGYGYDSMDGSCI